MFPVWRRGTQACCVSTSEVFAGGFRAQAESAAARAEVERGAGGAPFHPEGKRADELPPGSADPGGVELHSGLLDTDRTGAQPCPQSSHSLSVVTPLDHLDPAHVGGAPNSRVAAAPPDGWRGSAPGWSTALSQRGPGRRPPVAGSSPAALPANSCRLDFLSAGAQRRTETCCPAVVGGWTGTNLCPLPAGHLLFCCKDQGRS